MWRLVLSAGLLSISACARAPSVPDGVASSTLCADSYLLAVAPDRASALSWQAGSAVSVAQTPEQLSLPRISDRAEALWRVDALHVGGPGAGTADVALEWGEDFDTVRRNVRALADALDSEDSDHASTVLARLDGLSALPQPRRAPRVLYMSRSGGSAGAGTFVDAAIRAAGGTNASSAPGWHTPSVEAVLATPADIVVSSFFGSDYQSVNDRALRHAALRRYLAARPTVEVPGRLWPCAGPGLVEATEMINAAVLAWDAQAP